MHMFTTAPQQDPGDLRTDAVLLADRGRAAGSVQSRPEHLAQDLVFPVASEYFNDLSAARASEARSKRERSRAKFRAQNNQT